MEYQVPQFIEIEDKIVGPLTLKQFIYLAGGAGLCAIFFFTLPFYLAFLFSIPVGGFGVALAFYRVNNKPFVEIVESAVSYYLGAKLFLWRKEDAPGKAESAPEAVVLPVSRTAPRLTSGKLHELAWSLDVKDHAPK